MLKNIWRSLLRKRPRPITRTRLSIESLEDRVVPSSTPLHVAGNMLADSAGNPVVLRGVNIISLEWRTDGDNIMGAVNMALNDWHANLLRLPVNEDFWFGHNEAWGNPNDDGSAYRSLVDQVIATAKAQNAYVMLDLHWSDAGVWGSQNGQHRMPDDHSTLFWQDAAARYANNSAVLFDPYNEPHFDDNQAPGDADFATWQNGGLVSENGEDFGFFANYHSPGMQGLVNTIRATGANNVVAAEGLNWGADLSGVLNGHALHDPAGNLMYQAHLYYDNWQIPVVHDSVEQLAKSYPIYVGEWGSGGVKWQPSADAAAQNQEELQYFKDHNLNWTAWAMTPDLDGDSPYFNLVTSWDANATTSDYGVYVKDALAAAPVLPPPQGQPGATHVGFGAALNSGVGGTGPQLLTSGNFNSLTDSIPDLAVTNSDGSISILLGKGDGTYKPATQLFVDGVINPEGIVSGDFNHDGYDDLAVASNGAFGVAGAGMVKPGAVTILLGQGNGIFTRASALDLNVEVNGQALPSTVLPTYLATADMDGDGNLDLVVADFNNPHVYVYLGNGDGTFNFHDTNFDANGVSNAEQPVIADFNGDGILDIAVANKGNGTVSLFQGLGNGYITSAGNVNLPGVTGAIGLAAADLDGDGLPDLAVANYGTDPVGAHTLNLIRNTSANGNISFAVPTAISLGNHLLNVVIADFNEDGKLDLAVTSAGNTVDPNAVKDTSVWVLYNQGAFNFPKPQLPLFAGLNPVGLIAADLNGDGHVDLASANQDSNNVSVFLNQFAVPAVTKAALSVPANVDFGTPPVMAIFAITPPPGAAIPTGSVTFTVDGTQTNVASLSGVNWSLDQWVQTQPGTWIYRGDDGVYKVRVTLINLTTGVHTVSASYSGDAKHNAASDSGQVTVAKVNANIVAFAAPVSASQGAATVLSATVGATVSGMKGKVSFFDNGKLLGTANVVNGIAKLSTTALGVGVRSITARYEGDANFNASSMSAAQSVRVTGNLTSKVKFTRSAITLDPVSHHAVQTITITNISTETLPLPLTLRFSSLTSTRNGVVSVSNVVGRTGLQGTAPLLRLAMPNALAPGQSVSVKVTFGAMYTTHISYSLSALFL